MAKTLTQILEELNDLGNAATISRKFILLGIKGKRKKITACPLYNYLHDYCGAKYVMAVSQYSVYNNGETVSLTFKYPNVRDFVEKFDANQYPMLVEE